VNSAETGTFVGTGDTVRIHTGFAPSVVRLLNITRGASADWWASMGRDTLVKQVDGVTTAVQAGGVSRKKLGFAIGAEIDLNREGDVIHWAAWP
jgi:hypothetical protein